MHTITRTNIMLVLSIIVIEQCQQLNLRPRLHQKWLFTLDNLNCHLLVGLFVQSLDHLTKRPLAYAFLQNVSVENGLIGCKDIIEIVVVPAVVLSSGSLMRGGLGSGGLLLLLLLLGLLTGGSSCFSFPVVYLKKYGSRIKKEQQKIKSS